MREAKLKFLKAAFAALFLWAVPCSAEETESIDIEPIVITASRTEENPDNISREIDIITSYEIETSQAKDLSYILSQHSSVYSSSYGGPGALKTVKMRGSTPAQVLVMVDGRPINNPRDGEVDLSSIPLENIERIEVMRGPASSLYGSSAMGGTIHIITKKPPIEGRKTEVTSGFGTFRTYQERLSHGQRMGSFGYLFTGDFISSEGIRDNSAFTSKDFSVKAEQDIGDNQQITVNTGFYTSLVGSPGQTVSLDIDDKQRARKNFIDANWRLTLDPDTTISAKAYNNYDRLEFSENSAGSFFDTPFKKDIHTTQARGLDIQANKRFSEQYRIIGGFNYVLNLNQSTSSDKHRYSVQAGYIDNEIILFKDLKTNLGLRLDRYSNFGLQASPSASAMYRINEKNKIRGLISRSFRAPTFNDLYWPDEGWARGNPNLKPEKGITGEFGWQADLNPAVSLNLTYFRSYYDQLIQWAPDSADPITAVWMPTNVSSAVIEGIELENRTAITDCIDITAGYTYQSAKDDKTNKFLVYQPAHKIDFSINHKDILGWSAGIKGQWTSLRFHDAANTVKVDGFFLLGLYASKRWKNGVTYSLAINNALNKKYEYVQNYPTAGFEFTNSIKYEF